MKNVLLLYNIGKEGENKIDREENRSCLSLKIELLKMFCANLFSGKHREGTFFSLPQVIKHSSEKPEMFSYFTWALKKHPFFKQFFPQLALIKFKVVYLGTKNMNENPITV